MEDKALAESEFSNDRELTVYSSLRPHGSYNCLVFNDRAKQELRSILKEKQNTDNVESFINDIEITCAFMYIKHNNLTDRKVRNELNKVLRNFKKSLAYLESINMRKQRLTYSNSFVENYGVMAAAQGGLFPLWFKYKGDINSDSSVYDAASSLTQKIIPQFKDLIYLLDRE
ncbi:MAG: hypothetical protein U9P14_03060, partial [Gemmatimonadota bacterium]|nr:hypothetical protein [Gemmatimonadota bacterium]